MSFPVEASAATPGHAGHTPQHVDLMLRTARARGITSAGAFVAYDPVPIAMQPVPQPQGFGRLSQVAALIRLEDFRRRMDPRQPYPEQFAQGVTLAENPPEPAPVRVPAAPTRALTFGGER